ncbi:MFS transporter [Candidatus Epulonipiscium fishelsonii]|uniref:MFS transporter n=1 Tax=Candidatus Epulonipiscium fishelsonii TaxID=77094 RepID=A0ACC8XDZ9_9FIRM|nr:MFS transporter [Epulopiscium sp. SCG-B05WGA-EpuloA1]ONI41045.1 MFS transporter [Epulopiscium sp. SCG-B11WGA-EpuloA1]
MRRKDREVTNIEEIYKVIDECSCCRIGFYDEGEVYILPMNFGYSVCDNSTILYFHTAKEGRKIGLIEKSENVGFEMDTGNKLNVAEVACSCSTSFKSIIGSGAISFVNDKTEKEFALQKIMSQSTKKDGWKFDDKMLESVCIFKILVNKMTCKVHK